MAADWMPMTAFVFLYVLLLRSLNKLLSNAADMMLKISNKIPPDEEALIEEMKHLISEQQLINAQDEFPKYARLQRKIDSMKDKVVQYESNRKKSIGKYKRISKTIIVICFIAIHITFLVTYRKKPVIVLPSHWLYPLNKILSFPTGIPGALGLPCWMFSCNKMIQRFIF